MKLKQYKQVIILLSSIIVGSILGLIFKEKIVFIKPLGDIFLNLMFTLVVPLIFTTVVSSVANMGNFKKFSKIVKYTLLIFIITSFIAGLVMLITLKIINPVSSNIVLSDTNIEKVSFLTQIVKAITVTDFQNLFSKSNILPLIIFSFFLGLALNMIGNSAKGIINKITVLSHAIEKMVKMALWYAPIGLCAYFAALIGEYGPTIIGSYAKSIIIYYIVSIVYFIIYTSIVGYIKGEKIPSFLKKLLPSIATSLATQSSLATLPVNMEVSDDLNIDKEVSNICMPLGSTMHMEGSSMGAILKIVFIFSLLGIPFTFSHALLALLIAVISAVVMAGIPSGGLIGEGLIVSLYGLPASSFAVIATIGILIDPPATMLNATGDITSGILIDKIVNR